MLGGVGPAMRQERLAAVLHECLAAKSWKAVGEMSVVVSQSDSGGRTAGG